MKLFLSSFAINGEQKPYFEKLVGKKCKEIAFALIENAADPYPEENKGFMHRTREELKCIGLDFQLVDLNGFVNKPEELYKKLKDFDVVWVGGGNAFYIRWLMRETGFDQMIKKLLAVGLVYGGGSAGAIVAGPTLDKFEAVDQPEQSPELINVGLGLTDKIILPHWGIEKFQVGLDKIKEYYDKIDHEIVILNDDQSAVIEDGDCRIIPE